MPQDLQTTLTLILEAKDQASQVLQNVGHKMAELGQAAEALQTRAQRSGVPVSGPQALQTVLRENLEAVRQTYAQQESVVKGALDKQLAVERSAAETSLAFAKETNAKDLAALEKSYDDQRAVAQRARREADADARRQAVTERQASQQQRRTDLDLLKDDLARRRAAVKIEADEERAVWRAVTQEEMYKAAYDRMGTLEPVYKSLSASVKSVVDTGQGEAGLGAAHSMELTAYQGIVAAVDDAYKNRVRDAEISLQDALAVTERGEKNKLAVVQTYEDKETKVKNDAANERAARARETQRLAGEDARAAYARALADLERSETTATEVVKAQSVQRRAQFLRDLQTTLATTQSHYARELEVIRSAEEQETALLKSAGERQMQLLRRQAAEQERIARQQAAEETKSARERAAKAREPGIVGHGIAGLGNIVEQSLVWNAAYAVAGKINQAISAMASGLLSVNVQLEEYQATFTSIYQDQTKGAEAVKWLTNLAVQIPATRAQTIQAGLAIASLGDNIKDVLPPLANIASIMHVDLPRAAQAFADAQEGRFQMLQTTLHITKKELEGYGLEVSSTGKVLNNSFVPAFEKLGNVRFARAAADQMQTLGGAVSNLADVFTNLQAALGHGIFKALEDNLGKLLVMLGNPALQHFADVLGGQLGQALRGVLGSIEQWVQHMGGVPGLVTRVTLVIHDAAQVFRGLWGAIGNVVSVVKTLFDVASPLLGLLANLAGATNTSASRLRLLVQVLADAFIAYKVLWPMVGFVTAAMEKQKIAVAAATEAEVTCKTATMDLSVVLGENGLSGAAGTAKSGMEGLAAASGEAGAAGALGTASKAATVFGSRLGGMATFLTSTIGRVALLTGDIILLGKAWEQVQTFMQSTQQKQQLLDYGKALTPVHGTEATLGHLLWQGPASGTGGAAYIAYTNMLRGRTSDDRAGGTRAFIESLQSDPALMQTYMRYMTGQGAGARVQQALGGYTGLSAAGGGLVSPEQQQNAQNQQAYQTALNRFNADIATKQYATAATDLSTVQQAYQTYLQGSQTSQQSFQNAITGSAQLYNQLQNKIPMQYRLLGTSGDLSQHDQGGPSDADKLTAAKKALAQYKAHQWADTLRKIGLGTIDQTDVQAAVDQLKTDEAAAGQVVSDTNIMNTVRAATKHYVATLSAKLGVAFTALRDHVKGVTVQTVSDLINQIQQAEANVGLTDTTGAAQLRLSQWQNPTGTPLAGSPAADQVGYLRSSLSDAKAHLASLAKATPGATQAITDLIDQIAGAGGLVEQYDRARHVPWPQTLKDEETARLTLTREYLGVHKTSHALADAHSQLTIDLNTLGRSTKDYTTLMADAKRIQKDDYTAHHDKTHALAAYTVAVKAITAHMKHTEPGAGGVQVPTPLYGPYRITAPQYGATQVSFGGAQQNSLVAMVQQLQALVSYWRSRARADEASLRAEQETAGHTRTIAQRVSTWGSPLGGTTAPAPPPAAAGASVRARGGFSSPWRG